jgi:hypothetical protein
MKQRQYSVQLTGQELAFLLKICVSNNSAMTQRIAFKLYLKVRELRLENNRQRTERHRRKPND